MPNMRYRVFVPRRIDLNPVYALGADAPGFSIETRLVADEGIALNAPLDNSVHEDCYVAELHGRYSLSPSPPKFVLGQLGIERKDEVVLSTREGLGFVEAFPVVEEHELLGVARGMRAEYTGKVYRASYPIVDSRGDRFDANMWVMTGPDEIAEPLRDLVQRCSAGRFSVSTEEEQPVAVF